MKNASIKLLTAAAFIIGSLQPACAQNISKEFTESVNAILGGL